MQQVSPSVVGADYSGACSFGLSFTASAPSANHAIAIATGAYYLLASSDCDVRLGATNNDIVTQIAAHAQDGSAVQSTTLNATVTCPAGVPIPLDVTPNGPKFISAVAAVTGVAGTLKIIGPIRGGPLRTVEG